MKKKYLIEKKLIAQVRFYEELYVIKDEKGETIFTGREETAKKIQKLLEQQAIRREKRK
jgi:hypothetical protein